MPSDQEKSSFHLKRPDTPANKKHAEMRIFGNDSISRLIVWGGAFAFACSLVLASTFKRRMKIISPKRSRDGVSDLDVGGSEESTTRDADDKAQQMEGLQLLLKSSSTDINSRKCCTTSKMLVKYASREDTDDDHRHLTTEHISEKNEDENIVIIIYEEEEYPGEEKSIENKTQNYDESSKVVVSFSSRVVDETSLAEWKYKPSTSSSSSSSSSSSEETSSSGILLQEIDGDGKNIDIVIYIDNDDENGEDEQAYMVMV